MNRLYKRRDLVHVFKDSRTGPKLEAFRQAPYSMYGFDNYKYDGVMYKGFTHEGRVYILLSEPLAKEIA